MLLIKSHTPHADVVVLLSHSGLKEDRLFAEIEGIDFIIGGHSHTYMKTHEVVGSTPVFHSYKHGLGMGKIHFDIQQGSIQDIRTSLELLDEKYDVSSAESIILLREFQERISKEFSQVVGTSPKQLSPVHKRDQPTALCKTIAEFIRVKGGADIAFTNTGSIKMGFEEGPITKGAVYNALSQGGKIITVELSGEQVLGLLNKIPMGWGRPGNFDFSGIKIENIEPHRSYQVSAQPYFFEREFKGTLFEFELKALDIREALIEYIKENNGILPIFEP